MKCDVCGEDVPDDELKHVHINKKTKRVCEGCITAIKGLA
jgi:hypothetical protein